MSKVSPVKGPLPKPSNLLHGHGAQKERESTVTKLHTGLDRLVWPPAGDWSKPVVQLYESLPSGPMADLYCQSDVEIAYIACEMLDKAMTEVVKTTGVVNTTLFQAAMSALSSLGVTEGDRRRLRIEIERQEAEDATITAIQAGYRAAVRQERTPAVVRPKGATNKENTP